MLGIRVGCAIQAVGERVIRTGQRTRRVLGGIRLEAPVAQPVVEVEVRLVVVLVGSDQLAVSKNVRVQHVTQTVEFNELPTAGVEQVLVGNCPRSLLRHPASFGVVDIRVAPGRCDQPIVRIVDVAARRVVAGSVIRAAVNSVRAAIECVS